MKIHKLRVLVSAFVEVEIIGDDLTKEEAIKEIKDNARIFSDKGEICFTRPIAHFGEITQRPNKVIHKGTYEIKVPMNY